MTIATVMVDGLASYQDFDIDEQRFASYLRENDLDVDAGYGSDLYLVCACLEGNPRALAHLDRLLANVVPKALARIDTSASFINDITQELRIKLVLGGRDGVPKLRSFAGLGPLQAWIRVAAARTALNRKSVNRDVPIDNVSPAALVVQSPHSRIARQEMTGVMQSIFRYAFQELTPDERRILRRNHEDNVSIDVIAKELGMHRATAARHLQKARDRVKQLVIRKLRADLQLSQSGALSAIAHIDGIEALSLSVLASRPLDS